MPERHPLPDQPTHLPKIPDFPNARYGGYALPSAIAWQIVNDSPEQARARLPGIANHPHRYLAISGGGDDGAFGAGLLNGWTASGTRPEFDIVTGISTGALAAPFAFLGPAYDAALRQAFTGYSTEDLIRKRSMLTFLTGDSAVDVSGLKSVLAKFMNEEMVRAIALEYAKGRRLYIGTTNLDTGHAVLWDITPLPQVVNHRRSS